MDLTKPTAIDFSSLDSWAIPLDGIIPLSPARPVEPAPLLLVPPDDDVLAFAPIWETTPSEGFHPQLLRSRRAA